MTRAEFLAFLARCALDPGVRLTEDEAATLLANFDAGLIDPSALPMPLDQGVTGITREDLERVALILIALGLLRGNRERGRDVLRQQVIAETQQRATQVAAGELSVAQWQGLQRDAVRDHIAGQAILGAGSLAAALTLLPQLNQDTQVQSAFLSRFADTVAVGALMGAALTIGAIAARAVTYVGKGYSWFYKAAEGATRVGWVIDYVSKDDDNTCSACLDAEKRGPYLVGEGPMPGDICFGGGKCRCERKRRWDMKAWEKLAGRAQ